MDNFTDWVLKELEKRGWQQSELARQSGLDTGNLSRILNGTRNAGPDVCTAIAGALHLPPEAVFRAAGLLPAVDPAETTIQGIIDVIRSMETAEREEVLSYALWRFSRRREA